MPVKVQPAGEMLIYIGGIAHRVPILSFDITRGEVAQKLADSINRAPHGIVAQVSGKGTVDLISLGVPFSRPPSNLSSVWGVA